MRKSFSMTGGRSLDIRASEFSGVAQINVTNRDDEQVTQSMYLKEEDAVMAALAIIDSAGLLPELDDNGGTTAEWRGAYGKKAWEVAGPGIPLLRYLARYKAHLDGLERKEMELNKKILRNARRMYNFNRSACDLIWEDLNSRTVAHWVQMALLAEKLSETDD